MNPVRLVPRGAEADPGHPTLALLVGLACWGVDAVRIRARVWAAEAAEAAQPRAGIVELAPRFRIRGLLVGIAIVAPPHAAAALRRVHAKAAPAAHLFLQLSRPALRLGTVREAVRSVEALRARATAGLVQIATTGEREASRCEAMAEAGARAAYAGSLAAVGRATSVREVLVEQSAGLAGEALEELRSRSERADALVATAAQSLLPRFLRRRLPRSGAELGTPARTAGPEPPLRPAPGRGRG